MSIRTASVCIYVGTGLGEGISLTMGQSECTLWQLAPLHMRAGIMGVKL